MNIVHIELFIRSAMFCSVGPTHDGGAIGEDKKMEGAGWKLFLAHECKIGQKTVIVSKISLLMKNNCTWLCITKLVLFESYAFKDTRCTGTR